MRRAVLALLCSLLAGLAHAEGFRDPQDGAFDASDYLLERKGFLPVPILITEPAVGYGGGAMLLFFSESMAEANAHAKETGIMQPPNITGVGGMATENGTWGAGLFHFRTWGGDRYRYLGGLGKINLNTNYYGVSDQPRAYELDGWGLVQQLLVKLGDSRWFVGPRYTYFDLDTRFTGAIANELGNISRDLAVGKAGLVIDYDSRDNMFYPTRGSYMEIEAQAARDWLGSSRDFDTYELRAFTWLPLDKTWNLGLRIDGRATDGDVPFYAQPFVSLRGLPKGRYQDQYTLTGEMELRWTFVPRWSVLAFGGVGRAWGHWQDFSDADDAWGAGVGFRYLIARKLGLAVGIDVARSQDDNAFYFQVGSAWH
ncbi:glyceraldehyde-3-phosphate dehydrogenase [Chitiniphilus shinanonensis]|uniref:Glyceraldehyde-3-phosphate dehydrogenase n=1 Tax=Chitiniphilus shinanonensis TaxID=553088 RepID=A0ABQ6C0I1_9NEIS|nr:BamA/TamA family outer membrane protein [Chitiniphilus shinanonensis]GLS06007.1 glyceraldehyde-3-phosphate dehydrogenase [Chitiniphilus shinanonensis]